MIPEVNYFGLRIKNDVPSTDHDIMWLVFGSSMMSQINSTNGQMLPLAISSTRTYLNKQILMANSNIIFHFHFFDGFIFVIVWILISMITIVTPHLPQSVPAQRMTLKFLEPMSEFSITSWQKLKPRNREKMHNLLCFGRKPIFLSFLSLGNWQWHYSKNFILFWLFILWNNSQWTERKVNT